MRQEKQHKKPQEKKERQEEKDETNSIVMISLSDTDSGLEE